MLNNWSTLIKMNTPEEQIRIYEFVQELLDIRNCKLACQSTYIAFIHWSFIEHNVLMYKHYIYNTSDDEKYELCKRNGGILQKYKKGK